MPTVLIVDDEKSIRVTLETWLTLRGYQVLVAASLAEARRVVAGREFDAVILDVFLQGDDGLAWLDSPLAAQAPVILISGHGDLPLAVKAVKQGAFDFLEKPLDQDRLTLVLDRALEQSRLRREVETLREQRLAQAFVQGPSRAMAEVVALLRRVAPSPLSVLILGPSGSGKEGLAQAVHLLSGRSGGPLITANCAAIASTLFESELFGHRKGSFSGAVKDRTGFFSRAHRGTLFLDEVGEIPLDLQAKLLRALERGEIPVVGSEVTETVDVRIVAATNRDLPTLVAEGKFREDLYFRLNQVTLRVPSLDERKDDIPGLVEAFADDFSRKLGRPGHFSAEAVASLQQRSWPGNVRELRSWVERALVLSDGPVVEASAVESVDLRAGRPFAGWWDTPLPWSQAKPLLEKTYLEHQLELHGGKVSALAATLRLHPNNLSRKLTELGVRRERRG
ncbi:MAG: sigma-54 dependent transcriptional regulator [Spirochaetales bacterium]